MPKFWWRPIQILCQRKTSEFILEENDSPGFREVATQLKTVEKVVSHDGHSKSSIFLLLCLYIASLSLPQSPVFFFHFMPSNPWFPMSTGYSWYCAKQLITTFQKTKTKYCCCIRQTWPVSGIGKSLAPL